MSCADFNIVDVIKRDQNIQKRALQSNIKKNHCK